MNTRSSTRLNRIKREHKDGNQEQVPKPNINNGTRTSTRRKSIFKRMSSRLSMSLRLPGRNKSKSKRIKTQAQALKDKNIIKVNSKRITRSVTRGEKRDWDTPDVVTMVMATETATVREEDVAPVTVPYLEDEHETANITGTGISTSMKGIQSCKEDEDGEEIVYTTQHARKRRTNSPKFHLIEVDQSNVGFMKPDLIEMEDKTTNHIDIDTRVDVDVDVDVDENKGDQFESCATPIPSICESESSEPLASNEFNSESDSKIELEIDPDTDNDSDLINPSVSSDTDTSSHENTYTNANANANDVKEASSCNNARIVNIIEEENMDLAHVDDFCGDESISAHFDVVEDAASVQADVDLDLVNNDERYNKVVGDINEMHNLSAELPLGDDTVLQVDNKEMPNDNYYDK